MLRASWRPGRGRYDVLDMLGPFYHRRDEHGLAIGLRVAAKHANARGLAHGGLLLTLCDIALGYSAAYTEEPPLTLTTAHVSAAFAGSARVGDWVESRADVQRIGGRLAFVNLYLVVNSTRIVHASGVYLRGDPPAAARSTLESPVSDPERARGPERWDDHVPGTTGPQARPG